MVGGDEIRLRLCGGLLATAIRQVAHASESEDHHGPSGRFGDGLCYFDFESFDRTIKVARIGGVAEFGDPSLKHERTAY